MVNKELVCELTGLLCGTMGFSDGSYSKESTCNVGNLGSIPELRRSPGGGHGHPLQDSCLEDPYGPMSLEGYSPCGHEESDMTERLTRESMQTVKEARLAPDN